MMATKRRTHAFRRKTGMHPTLFGLLRNVWEGRLEVCQGPLPDWLDDNGKDNLAACIRAHVRQWHQKALERTLWDSSKRKKWIRSEAVGWWHNTLRRNVLAMFGYKLVNNITNGQMFLLNEQLFPMTLERKQLGGEE